MLSNSYERLNDHSHSGRSSRHPTCHGHADETGRCLKHDGDLLNDDQSDDGQGCVPEIPGTLRLISSKLGRLGDNRSCR
jgi:hypothetical protein